MKKGYVFIVFLFMPIIIFSQSIFSNKNLEILYNMLNEKIKLENGNIARDAVIKELGNPTNTSSSKDINGNKTICFSYNGLKLTWVIIDSKTEILIDRFYTDASILLKEFTKSDLSAKEIENIFGSPSFADSSGEISYYIYNNKKLFCVFAFFMRKDIVGIIDIQTILN
jgi:hypothetical protein